MIITRSPLRISLGGGGTDLPSYYQQHEGFCVSAAIDRYVYITLHETFVPELILKYSEVERVSHVRDVRHPIVKAALLLMRTDVRSLEIASMADVHAGTGLGSSGSFTVALLKALHQHQRSVIGLIALAEKACHIEINVLNEPVGKQDQYIASFGGINGFYFAKDGHVTVQPLVLARETIESLNENLLLFFTGHSRSASKVLADQDKRTKAMDADMLGNLHFIKQLGLESKDALECGDLPRFADLMNVHWEHKRKRSSGMTDDRIDESYQLALDHGALGGKLVGAGGGGFLMFYAKDRDELRRTMASIGLREVRFQFDFQGTTAVVA